MSLPAYKVRNYRPADFERCRQLEKEAEKERSAAGILPLDFAARLLRPGFFPERNIVVAETSGEIIACLARAEGFVVKAGSLWYEKSVA